MKNLVSRHRLFTLVALSLIVLLVLGTASAFARGRDKGAVNPPVAMSGPLSTVQVKLISYATRQPIQGARVGFSNGATGYSATATTDANGVAVFAGVPYASCYAADLSCAGFVGSIRLVTVDEAAELVTLAMLDK